MEDEELLDDAGPLYGDEDVIDTEDGGAIVLMEDTERKPGDSEFYDNLAEVLPEGDLKRLATTYLELIGRDKEARKKRDEQYEEGIRRTGLGDDAPGGAQFQGASRVVHPMLTEVCVDFSSRAIKELLPADGPVKTHIVGEATRERTDKAWRKATFMNWQLTTQSQEFRGELEQLLTQVPLGGVQYMKVTWDEKRNRPNFMFVPIDDVYLPYAATNFYTAQRKTHVQYLTTLDYQQRVDSGMYRDVDLISPGQAPEGSDAEQANNKVEGREETSYNEDGLRTVYEIYTYAEIEDDIGAAPYIVTVDKSTSQVLSIYRNWSEDDETYEALQWMVEFPFVPWRGAYPIGITHMIGGLSAASTGALRALLDAAHISNSQTMLKLKGGSRGGQSLNIQPTQVEEIEGGLNVDDVRKIAMPLPFNPPSQVLFQLLGFLVDSGKGVVRTTLDDMSDTNQNVPVGTTLAKIEQGMVVFSAIHARLHNAMGHLLRIMHRLNGMYLDDDMEADETGSVIATRNDFEGPMDVVPVSDPNIFSEAQRFAQVQAVAQRASLLPQLYNVREVEEMLLRTLKIPQYKTLLNPPVEPQHQNAVAENVTASLGKPIVAFPEQDHIAHIKTHLGYLMSPVLGMSKLIAPSFIPGMLNHLKEHIAMWYASQVYALGTQAAGVDLGDMARQAAASDNDDAKREFDRVLAEASQTITERSAQALQLLPPVIEQAMQLMQQLAPQPPIDPSVAVAQAETNRRAQADQAKSQVDMARLQMEQQRGSAEAQVRAAQLQADQNKVLMDARLSDAQHAQALQVAQLREQHADARAAAQDQTKLSINAADNRTAEEIAAAQIEAGKGTHLSTGTGIHPQE